MFPDEPGQRLSAVLSSRPSPPPPSASPHSRGIPNDREITAHLYQFTGCLFIKAHSRVPFTILPLRTSRIALPSPSRHPRSVADYPASPPRRSDSVSLVPPKRFRRLVKNNIKSTSLTSPTVSSVSPRNFLDLGLSVASFFNGRIRNRRNIWACQYLDPPLPPVVSSSCSFGTVDGPFFFYQRVIPEMIKRSRRPSGVSPLFPLSFSRSPF